MSEKIAAYKSRRIRIPQSVQKRSHLVESTKDFSLNQHPSEKDATKYRELFYSLILKADSSERKLIGQYLSRIPHTPRPIAIYFGLDEIDNAAPMLLFSPVFQALDLTRIIEKQDIQHASVIARRNDLETQTIHDLLLKDDEEGTLRTLIHHNPSINRSEKVIALLNKSTKELRAELAIEEPSEPLPALEVSQTQEPKDLSEDLLALARKDNPYRTGVLQSQRIVGPSEKLGKRLLTYAKEHDYEGLTLLIHKTCLLDWEKIGSLLSSDNTGMQTTLLRALDIPIKEASQLMLLINSNIGRNLDVFKLIMLKYQNLNLEDCQKFYQNQGAVFGELQTAEMKHDPSRKHFSSLLTQRRNSILSTDAATPQTQEEVQTLKSA